MDLIFPERSWARELKAPEIKAAQMMALFGTPGSGKTGLAMSWAMGWISQGKTVAWFDFSEARGVAQRRWKVAGFSSTPLNILSDLSKVDDLTQPVDILVIDYLQMAGTKEAEQALVETLPGLVKKGTSVLCLAQIAREATHGRDSAAELKGLDNKAINSPLGEAASRVWLIHPYQGPVHDLK